MKCIKTITALLILLFTAGTAHAQQQRSSSYILSFHDSLSAGQHTNFLYPNLHIKNISNAPITVSVTVQNPPGWKLLTTSLQNITINSGDSADLPFTLAKKQQPAIGWQSLRILLNDGSAKDSSLLHVRTAEVSDFSVAVNPVLFSGKARSFETSVLIKNTGNVPGNYVLRMNDEVMALDLVSKISLAPGKDSLYRVKYTVPKSAWNKFNSSKIMIDATDINFVKKEKKEQSRFSESSNGNSNNFFITNLDIVRTDSNFKKYSSPYTLIKTDIQTGYLRNNYEAAYFFGVRGEMPLTSHSSLTVDYRSRQYGVYNIIDRDLLDIFYTNKRFSAHVGRINDSKYFYSYGTGVSMSYTKSAFNKITLYGVIHTPGFYAPSDSYGMNTAYKLRSWYVNHDAVYNVNNLTKEHSYLLNNEVKFKKKPGTDFSFSYSIADVQNRPLKTNTIGQSYGSAFNYKIKKFSIAARAVYFDRNYPGTQKNHQSDNVNLRYGFKKGSLETFYRYDHTVYNYFTDTLYNTTALTNNIKQYGVRYNLALKKSNFSIGTGRITQTGSGNIAAFLGPEYQYGEFQYSFRSRKNFIFSLSSTTAYTGVADKPAYFSVNSFNVAYKQAGINGGFSNVPQFQTNDSTGKRTLGANQQTIYGGPYISATLWKNIYVNAQYNLSKTLYDNSLNRFVSFNLSYNNEKAGIQLNLNGYAPLKNNNTNTASPIRNGYMNLSFRKRLFVPFAVKRKYHVIHGRLFKDDNGNNKFDKGEQLISHAALGLNDLNVITDKSGNFSYRNTDKGTYAIDLGRTDVFGYLPAAGSTDAVTLKQRDVTVDIPFKKSRTVTGLVTILHDTNNTVIYNPQNIKIIATDSAGAEHYSLTDREGRFYLTLPAGKYTVMPAAQSSNEIWKLETKSFAVNLIKDSSAVCNFVISQKKRGMKMLTVTNEVKVEKKDLITGKEAKHLHDADTKNAAEKKPSP